ncbi:sterol desaturase family protein [Halioxenophilus aromaticivorans]|uniref:Fatty acid hydroxylase domain-containing protein n=1 Tax=Halioxenophilus aromaticivorans TaxID=1306992 RepID=A0AAV3TYS1_9ALTE
MDLNTLNNFLTDIAVAPFTGGSRLAWPFLVASVVLLFAFLLFSANNAVLRGQARQLLTWRYWLNGQSGLDLAYTLLNSALKLWVLVPLLASQMVATIWVINLLQQAFGPGPDWQLAAVGMAGLFTVVFFLLDDVTRFALHWALHRVPGLWHLHKVHHAAENLTPLTLLRVHPLEMALYYCRSLAVVSVVGGVFIYCFVGKVMAWDIIGINGFAFLFNALGANLRHSPVAIQFGALEKWFISPAQHQIHHSVQPQHHNVNYGSALAIWDRWLGSWRSGAEAIDLKFGLSQGQPLRDHPSTSHSPASGQIVR